MILAHFYEQARRAHYNTSFVPEKRANQIVKDFSEELENDLNSLPEEARERYQKNYEKYLSTWLAAKSNCISSMITGPARFPTARAEKWNNRERAHYEKFREWRERAQRAIARVNKPKITPLTELESATNDLAVRELNQKRMVEANKLVRAKLAGTIEEDEFFLSMAPLGFSTVNATKLLEADYCGRVGFPDYALTNNNANIRRLRDRVAELQLKVEKATAPADEYEFAFDGGRLFMNYEADRFQLFFNEKPDPETRSTLKSSGFNWSPSAGAWQRKITVNAVYSIGRVLGIDTEPIRKKMR
jgi:hypothetical protein